MNQENRNALIRSFVDIVDSLPDDVEPVVYYVASAPRAAIESTLTTHVDVIIHQRTRCSGTALDGACRRSIAEACEHDPMPANIPVTVVKQGFQ